MNRILISFLFVLLFACGSSEVQFQNLDISYDGEIAKYEQKGKLYTGVAIEEYSARTIKHHIKEGLVFKEEGFYPTGEKERLFNLVDGLKHGECKVWYKDGTVEMEETYELGKLHGSVKRYDFTGELIEEKKFDQGVLVKEE